LELETRNSGEPLSNDNLLANTQKLGRWKHLGAKLATPK